MKNEVKNYDLFIGILLIMPIYMAIFVVLERLGYKSDNTILFPALMYLPIILGILFGFKKKKSILPAIIVLMIAVSVFFYYDTYFVDHEGFEGIAPYIMWLATTAITKFISAIYYGKIARWKNALILFIVYILVVILSFAVGFWA